MKHVTDADLTVGDIVTAVERLQESMQNIMYGVLKMAGPIGHRHYPFLQGGNMRLLVDINGREAIPVRALPFIASFWYMSPDKAAKVFSRTCDIADIYNDVKTFEISHGKPREILPKEWDSIRAQIEVFSRGLKANEAIEGESYPQWYQQSISLLPAGVFVWRDEFEAAFKRFQRYNITNREGDRELNYEPLLIRPDFAAAIFEGFSSKKLTGVSEGSEAENHEYQGDEPHAESTPVVERDSIGENEPPRLGKNVEIPKDFPNEVLAQLKNATERKDRMDVPIKERRILQCYSMLIEIWRAHKGFANIPTSLKALIIDNWTKNDARWTPGSGKLVWEVLSRNDIIAIEGKEKHRKGK